MKIYFLRHAHASWPDWDQPDKARPVTDKGEKQSKRVAKFLSRLAVSLDSIFTSPLLRAVQTAEIVGGRLRLDPVEEPLLAPGFDAKKLARILAGGPPGDILLVGHEPDFSRTIGEITGGRVELPKAGIACVEVDGALRGKILWLMPQKLLRRR